MSGNEGRKPREKISAPPLRRLRIFTSRANKTASYAGYLYYGHRRDGAKLVSVFIRGIYPYYRGYEYDVTLKAPLTIRNLDDKWR